MTPEEMLESRHTAYLEWHELWLAIGPQGNPIDAHVTLRATVHDCVNMARARAHNFGKPVMDNDKEFLCDFIAIHWAEVKDEET